MPQDEAFARLSRYYPKSSKTIYTALEELDFHWSTKQVKNFDFLWKEGHSLEDIASYFSRDIDEVAVLLIDRTRKGKIKPRRSGINDMRGM